jgi:hypothetical protein
MRVLKSHKAGVLKDLRYQKLTRSRVEQEILLSRDDLVSRLVAARSSLKVHMNNNSRRGTKQQYHKGSACYSRDVGVSYF